MHNRSKIRSVDDTFSRLTGYLTVGLVLLAMVVAAPIGPSFTTSGYEEPSWLCVVTVTALALGSVFAYNTRGGSKTKRIAALATILLLAAAGGLLENQVEATTISSSAVPSILVFIVTAPVIVTVAIWLQGQLKPFRACALNQATRLQRYTSRPKRCGRYSVWKVVALVVTTIFVRQLAKRANRTP